MKKWCLLAVMFLVCGCAMPEVVYRPYPSSEGIEKTSEIFIYRNLSYFASLPFTVNRDPWVVAVNDRNMARLAMGQYTFFRVPAWKMAELQLKRWDMGWRTTGLLKITVPGLSYHFIAEVTGPATFRLKEISPEQGAELQKRSDFSAPGG